MIRRMSYGLLGSAVEQEDIAVASQAVDALLDASPARIAQPDDGRAHLGSHFHHLADLLGMRQRQRAAKGGEILGKDKRLATVDRPPAGDHAVAGDLALGQMRGNALNLEWA